METNNMDVNQENQPVAPSAIAGDTGHIYSVRAKSNARIFLLGVVGVVAAAIFVTLVVGVARVYAYAKTDPFTVTVARILRLPAATVNGKNILYSDYADDIKSIVKLRDYDAKNGGPSADITDEIMSDQVLWRLTNNILLNEAAKLYGVTVENKDVDDVKSQILQQFPDPSAADKELENRYGWTLAKYAEKVIRPYVVHNKLSEKMGTDQQARETVRAKAEKVLNEIKGGKDFAEAATQYGEDGTATQGGDLGWFGTGEMVPEFEKVAFALKNDELAPNLVETEFGYHIIRTEDKKIETTKDASGKNVKVEKVQARHILFRYPSADTYLDSAARKAAYRMYIRVHNPFEQLVK